MWCHIKLFMVQGKYNIDALMDLKIDKNMVLKDFKNLLQKLALQMWNRCVTVFKEQRSKAVQKSSVNFKLYSQETNQDLKRLSMFELQTIQNIFILTDIKVLGSDEEYKKDAKKEKKNAMSAFERKPIDYKPRHSNDLEQNSPTKATPLMELSEETKVSELMSYRKNDIKVVCKFKTLLEYFME